MPVSKTRYSVQLTRKQELPRYSAATDLISFVWSSEAGASIQNVTAAQHSRLITTERSQNARVSLRRAYDWRGKHYLLGRSDGDVKSSE